MTYRLSDLFSSIQGEGACAGMPCTFIRFATCNLTCPWCDTKNVVKMGLPLVDVLTKLQHRKNRHVVITGGEPTIQPGLEELVDALKEKKYILHLETNGLVAPACLAKFDYVAVSPKSMYQARYRDNVMVRKADEVRIVAASSGIGAFCAAVRKKIEAKVYYISPLEEKRKIHYRRAFKLLEELNKEASDNPWRLSIQQHKVLGMK